MGKGIVDELKKEFDIREEWVSLEIHPETPKEGMLLSKRFGNDGLERMASSLKRAGKAYGIEFGELKLLSNSRMALEASEYARDNGRFDRFNEKVFYAYFTLGKDIGNIETIVDIAANSGLDTDRLVSAIDQGIYRQRLMEAAMSAQTQGINSTPTFIINEGHIIVGAQPIDAFRQLLKSIGK